MNTRERRLTRPRWLLTLSAWVVTAVLAQNSLDREVTFDIPAQSLTQALLQFGQQAQVQIMLAANLADGQMSESVKGTLKVNEALTVLLNRSGLSFDAVGNTVTVRPRGVSLRELSTSDVSSGSDSVIESSLHLVQTDQSSVGSSGSDNRSKTDSESSSESSKGIPEVLVRGSKILNMDVKRSRNDAQPYVILEREVIERSGAVDLGDFLKQRLTMNTVAASNSQTASTTGNTSSVNLRGLGSAQTLILLDGRRIATPLGSSGAVSQSDLNGIPLSAIERIEVLPTTASGIYGGSATGGVVNVVMRRDYAGAEIKVTYDNTFDTDSARKRIDAGFGLNFREGKTNILMVGSYSDANSLLVRDRQFAFRARETIMANNPGFFVDAANPPLGATTNIRSVNGSALFGPGTPNFTSVPVGFTGGGGIAAFAANAGRYNLQPPDSAQADGLRRGLMVGPRVESIALTARSELSPGLQAFVEAAGYNSTSQDFGVSLMSGVYTIAADAPNNPFGQAIRVTVPSSTSDGPVLATNYERRLAAGLILQLPGTWRASTDFTWSRSRMHYTQPNLLSGAEAALISNGSLNVLVDPAAVPYDFGPFRTYTVTTPFKTIFRDAALRLAGPIGHLPAGAAALSLLLEHREQDFGGGTRIGGLAATQIYPYQSQQVSSAYAEIKVPLVSHANRLRAIHALEFQLAARYDHYTTNAAGAVNSPEVPVVRSEHTLRSVDPTFGLRYLPTPGLILRVSYGTGFLPPAVNQLLPGAPFASSGTAQGIVDPLRGNEVPGVITITGGGSPNVRPEDSRTFSAGVVFMPQIAPALRLSIDWTRIEKRDNFTNLSAAQVVANETIFAGRVIRANPEPGDAFQAGRIIAVNTGLLNIARAEVEAYDLSVDYSFEPTKIGQINLYALATWQTHYRTQLLPSSPIVENVGIGVFNPLKFKANAGMTWNRASWTVGWAGRFFSRYRVSTNAAQILNQGSPWVDSQLYHDVFASYRISQSMQGRWAALLVGTELQLGIRNVLNTEPPFDAGSLPVPAGYSPYGDPRLASYYISLRRSF